MLTNLGYEEDVPQRYSEIAVSLVAQNLKVIIDAYILGTLFHYLVKTDPEKEESKEVMKALQIYCTDRGLPGALHSKMRSYLQFQQTHSTAVADNVIKV
jgi:hypothetical protein